MEGNKFDCTLSYDPSDRKDSSRKREYVFVPFNVIFDYKVRETNFELQYEIIQRLKEINGKKRSEHDKLPTLKENERDLIMRYIERFRPKTNWDKIAEMLGTTVKTLWEKRNKYDLP